LNNYDEPDNRKRLLVVEDDNSLGEVIKYNFLSEGYEVKLEKNGKEGLDSALRWQSDVIILDLMLPLINGIEICRTIRKEGIFTPVIILTAKDTEVDRVVGLEVGADDYVTKPFSTRELIARVGANIRRTEMIKIARENYSDEIINTGNLIIDKLSRKITLNNQDISLRPREYDLLLHMASNPSRVFTRDQLLQQVWGYEYAGDTRTIDVHVRWLRRKIEKDPSNPILLQTIRGVGYRFHSEV
tara:strand:+ start:1524 stop:2252 length:729 start_codon:yes stop_codon:yes gene_type:complete